MKNGWNKWAAFWCGVSAAACAGGTPPAEEPAQPVVSEPVTSAPGASAANPSQAAPQAAAANKPQAPKLVVIELANPLPQERKTETIAISRKQLEPVLANFDPNNLSVADDQGQLVLSQWVDSDGNGESDELVFQADLPASGKRSFALLQLARKPAKASDYKVYGRFVRERFDDFAWENDLLAARMYGPALEKAEGQALVSSGVDAWVKKNSDLVINDWFMTGDYHEDHGQGGDFYSVGKTRGCGGLGIWVNGKLQTSKNFAKSRVLASGPIRLVFELEYGPWYANGKRITEVKRVQLDAGSSFNQVQSRFKGLTGRRAHVALGIAKHEGALIGYDAATGFMRTWEPLNNGKNGNLGCAVMLPTGTATEQAQDDANYLMLVGQTPKDGQVNFQMGWVWDQRGNIKDAAAWDQALRNHAALAQAPIAVTLAAVGQAAAPAAQAAPPSPAAGQPPAAAPAAGQKPPAAQPRKAPPAKRPTATPKPAAPQAGQKPPAAPAVKNPPVAQKPPAPQKSPAAQKPPAPQKSPAVIPASAQKPAPKQAAPAK